MPLKRALALLGLAATVSLVLSFALSAAAQDSTTPESRVASVVWSERPDSVSELERLATAVVEAEVVSVVPGPDLVGGPEEIGAENRIPTQRVTMRTVQTLEGQAPPLFELFKTGSDGLYLEGDPPYQPGERYVLFVRPRQGEPGTFLPAAPDGRLALDPDGKAQGLIDGPVKEALSGETPAQIQGEISG